MMGLLRKVKDKTYSPIEVKVREATSNDKWGAPLSLQREIASYTHDPAEYPKLFAMLWKRLTDHEHLTHVQKALILLHYLLRHGSTRFVEDAMARKNDVARLQKYKHYTGDKEDAAEARQLAKQTFAMLNDAAVISAARKTAAGEKKQAAAVPIADEDDEQPDEVERAAEKKRAAAMAKIPSKKASVPKVVEPEEEEEEEEEVEEEEHGGDDPDDDEEAKRAAQEMMAAVAATEISPSPQRVAVAAVPVKKPANSADDFFASLGGSDWNAPAAQPVAAQPRHADPWDALAAPARPAVQQQQYPPQQQYYQPQQQQPQYAAQPHYGAPATSPYAAAPTTPNLALDPFAPIPAKRVATTPAPAPTPSSAGFLDGTEW